MKLTGVRKKIHPTSCEDASKYQLSKPIDKRGCIINKASSLPGGTQMVQHLVGSIAVKFCTK